MDGLPSKLAENWRVITEAPLAAALFAITAFVVCWGINRWLFSNQIGNLESRLHLRDDEIADYKRKLEGATPDQAAARIEALEAAVRKMSPREFTPEQLLKITQTLIAFSGEAKVVYDMAYAEGQKLAGQLIKAMRAAGWKVHDGMIGGPSFLPDEGITLHISPLEWRQPDEAALVAAFDACGIPFAEQIPAGRREAGIEIAITRPSD